MTVRSHVLPRLLLPSAIALAGLAAATLAAPPAEAAGKKLTGTITWTRTVAINENVPGDHTETGTETTKASLTVRLTGGGAGGWNGADKAAKYTGSYALTSTRNESDGSGAVSCVVTHSANATGAGATLATGTIPPGKATKGIVLTANPRYAGTDTVTYTGQGISPCDPGQDVDPIDGSLLPTNDARMVCYPNAASKKVTTIPTANDIVGAWNAKKKAYVFDCTKTYPDAGQDGHTVTVRISGSLKWS